MPANSARAAGSRKREPREGRRGEQRRQPEARHEDRVARRSQDGSEQPGQQSLPFARERSEQRGPRGGVAAERVAQRRDP